MPSGGSLALVSAGIGVLGVSAIGGLLHYYKRRTHTTSKLAVTPHKPEIFKLYHCFPFRSCRCAWLINEMGISDQVDFIPLSLHGKRSMDMMPQYKKEINPHGSIPALVLQDGTVILDSGAICTYLAFKFGNKGMMPTETSKVADFYNMIAYTSSKVDHVLEPLYMQLTHTSEEKQDKELIDKLNTEFDVICQYLSQHLESQSYACGDQFTAADCMLGYSVWWAAMLKEGSVLQRYPVLDAYLNRLKVRQSFKDVFEGAEPYEE